MSRALETLRGAMEKGNGSQSRERTVSPSAPCDWLYGQMSNTPMMAMPTTTSNIMA